MYLHVGQSTVIVEKDIIGIFDMDITTVQKSTRDFLNKSEKNKEITNVSYELPKTFVVCESKGIRKTYILPVAPSTLEKRLERNS